MSGSSGSSDIPLILFSGMGADASVFRSQKLAFPNLIVPDWPTPHRAEDLSAYCARLAKSIDPGCPCIVGGASYGGIVALEMRNHLNTVGCLLIGSVRGPHQLPRRVTMLRAFSSVLGIVPISLLQRFAALTAVVARKSGAEHLAGVARQFSDADTTVLRWSAKQVLCWGSAGDNLDAGHIHGDRDRVFPVSCVEPDEIVVGGGHAISMTHGPQVNEFLRHYILQITAMH